MSSVHANPIEEIQATILIEALVTLDDGVTVPCRVSAADRCKEVARRFVADQSLKAHFEAPLTAFLKDVEDNAERFPVQVAMNLSDIREKFCGNELGEYTKKLLDELDETVL